MIKQKRKLLLAILLVVCALFLAPKGAVLVESLQTDTSKLCVVIDAGHGGSDPGKIGVNEAKEKDINLEISLKLKEVLEKHNISVVLTRDSDEGLYSSQTANQKAQDMQNRCKIIEQSNAQFTISIHQNSYTSPEIKGAQTFYYGQSVEGKKLAEEIQAALIAHVDPQNHRAAKANESYYLLKKTPTPTVIVECGFLSNPTEADLLLQDDYQNKLVNAIYLGISQYLGETPLETETIPSTETFYVTD